MKRLSFALLLSLSMALVACGDDGGDDGNNNPDVCAGKALCSTEGTSCSGDSIVTCAPDVDGCLVETVDEDCSASSLVCDDSGAAPECVADACTDDAACDGAADGDSFCSGDSTVSCSLGADGCLDATTEDCTAGGNICDDSAGSAECVAACEDHPACVGATDGVASCDGFLLNSCSDTNGDGCLELVDQLNCGPALCDDSAAPAICGNISETGLACGDEIPVAGTGFVIEGDDFTADFASGTDFTDNASCGTTEVGAVSAIFSVSLLAGETVTILNDGDIFLTMATQSSCDAAGVCADAGFDTISHTAAQDETVILIAQAEQVSPANPAYKIKIAIDPVCGNGLVELDEDCDDGNNTDGDGCDATCDEEFGFDCDGASPTLCVAFPDLGSFGPGETVDPLVKNDAMVAGDFEIFTITFETGVFLDGTLSANGTGDFDFFLLDDTNNLEFASAVDGDEDFVSNFIPAGSYLVIVSLFDEGADADMGYTLALTTGPAAVSVANGDTFAETGTGLVDDDVDLHVVTLSEDLLLTGTLTSDNASDFDLRIFGIDGELLVEEESGDESFVIALPMGTYYFHVLAFSAADTDTYSLDFTAASLVAGTNIADLGTFSAGDAIAAFNGGAVPAGSFTYHQITFNDDVLFTLEALGGTTGDFDLRLYDGADVYDVTSNGGTMQDVELAAGTYFIELEALGGGDDVDAYTFNMSSTAPSN